MEFSGGSAGSEEAVGVVPHRQIDNSHAQTGMAESLRQSAGGLASCRIGIEGKKHGTVRPVGQLRELGRGQVNAEGAGGVEKARLPKDGQIEETFDQNYMVVMADRAPGEEAAFGTCKEAVGHRAAQTAAIEIDGAAFIQTRKHDAAVEGVLAVMDEPGLDQQVCRISQLGQVAVEPSTWGVSDGELLDQSRIVHAPALQVLDRFGMLAQLLPVEVDRLSQRVLRAGLGQAEELFQMRDRFWKR